jgi:radical SAM/Cys-rich protein
MERSTVEAVLHVLRRYPSIRTVDITGGAPEMNPYFEYLVDGCRELDRHVIDRCNLTVFFVRGKEHLPEFLRDHEVEIVASLPCYLEENVDAQRGKGVYGRSIEALKRLNGLGYGLSGSGLLLNLVYNPVGPTLPPPQSELEADFKVELRRRFGIEFNRLFTITNMPISRFMEDLRRSGAHDRYMHLLAAGFNLAASRRVMCRTLVSVGWDGTLYDCDFNQMLDLPLHSDLPRTIKDFDLAALERRRIVTRDHCFGCTAGAGSSCGGAVV